MKNYLMIIQYDGTSYHGWQKQGNTTNTIQEIIEKALIKLLQEDIEIHGSGRTDAGVHAKGQAANLKCQPIKNIKVFLLNLNRELPRDIQVIHIREVNLEFHSRLSATAKLYSYHISNGQRPRVFRRKYVYHYDKKLDIGLMKKAAGMITGTHDFRGFSSEKNPSKSCIRNLYEITIEQQDNEITISYYGNGFIYNMVRILTGTLLEIGAKERQIEDINTAFETRKREFAGFMVPAHGLFLEKVEYSGTL
jgi:tRNA pseudouridine38-40 synthase